MNNILTDPVYTNATLLHPSYRQAIPQPQLKMARANLLHAAMRMPTEEDDVSEGIYYLFCIPLCPLLVFKFLLSGRKVSGILSSHFEK